MPMYDWICTRCAAQAEVIRPIADSDLYPTPEETTKCPGEETHDWVRRLSAPSVVKGDGWGGGKGNWLQLFLLGAIWFS